MGGAKANSQPLATTLALSATPWTSSAAVRQALDRLTTGAYRYETDSGSVIAVRVDVNRHRRRSD